MTFLGIKLLLPKIAADYTASKTAAATTSAAAATMAQADGCRQSN
jgi:hypothetical protein